MILENYINKENIVFNMLKKEVVFVLVGVFFLIGASCERVSQVEVCNNPKVIEGVVVCDAPPENCEDFILIEGEKVCTVLGDGK